MENARRAGRHLQRAQELLGFDLNFGEGQENRFENMNYKLMTEIFANLEYKDIQKMKSTDQRGRGIVNEYIEQQKKATNALMQAVVDENMSEVDRLLKSHTKITTASMLTEAVHYGNKEIVELLLDNGEDKNINQINEKTKVHMLSIAIIFIQNGSVPHCEVAELLINRGADVNAGLQSCSGSVFSSLLTDLSTRQETDNFPVDKVLSVVKLFLEKGAKYDQEIYDSVKSRVEFHQDDLCESILEMLDPEVARVRSNHGLPCSVMFGGVRPSSNG